VRRRLGVLAAASILAMAGPSWALGLGRVTVQSALGEPLRAEVDVTSLSAEEASSLALRIASPEAYRAAGVDYSDLLGTLQVSLQRRPDGRPVIRLSSPRAVQEPFLDVILELTWSAGRLVREYTLLVDPPRTAAPAAPAVPAVVAAAPVPAPGAAPPPPASPAPAAVAPAAVAPGGAAAPSGAAAPPPVSAAPAPAPAAAPAPVPSPAAAPARPPAAAAPAAKVRVKSGDTLGGIARGVQAPGVSLDQMLVALFRSNPQAFIDGNMNRVKAGAVLDVPSAEQVAAVSPAEARALIVAQSADFAAYRGRLAAAAPTAVEAAPSREASGKVEAAVQDRKEAAAPTGDRLKLSQGAVKPGTEEAKVSRETASRESAARVAELSRNVEELRKLQGAASAARPGGVALPGAPAVAPPAPAAAPRAPAAAPVPAPAQPGSPAAPAASVAPVRIPADRRPDPEPPLVASPSASAPIVAASAPAAAPAPVKRVPAPAPAPAPQPTAEPGLLDSLTEDNPFLLPAAGGLLALLVGLGAWRMRGRFRRGGAGADSAAFGESKLQRDSFFGGTGGGRVDTQEGMSRLGQGSSIGYSLSQLDAIGDVDPVAEADVYLAYGRDLQAEEILKEALRAHPERLAIKTKLLEVYAKRRDVRAFEMMASQVYLACDGQGEEWQKVQDQGQAIDPDNPLYQPGGKPDPQRLAADSELDPSAAATLRQALPPSGDGDAAPGPGPAAPRVDLDLGLDEPGLPAPPPPASQGASAAPVQRTAAAPAGTLPAEPAPTWKALAPAPGLAAAPAPGSAPPAGEPLQPLDFDLSAISLDLDTPSSPVPAPSGGLDFSLDEGAAPSPASAPTAARAVSVTPVPSTFDLPSLDFDLSVSPQAAASQLPASELPAFELPDAPAEAVELAAEGDPLARKIELAEEFSQIGDQEGARELLMEVLAQAEGELKVKAQALLARLG
jgi:pilus assembly protein FimV